MEVQLLKKSEPFQCKMGGLRFRDAIEGIFITFLAKTQSLKPEIKQFYCFVESNNRIPLYFSTLLFAREGDFLEVLPYRYANDLSVRSRIGFGSEVINVKNLSRSEFDVCLETQAYNDEWDVGENDENLV